MGAKKVERLTIAVTNGDAIASNKTTGKSNTGTYFLCSEKNFENMKIFFEESIEYYFDLDKIFLYQIIVNSLKDKIKNNFVGQMKKFDECCNSFRGIVNNPKIFIDLRINDSRYFFRFKDNDNYFVDSFRHLLYADISNIIMELEGNKCKIYPEFNYIDDKYKEKEFSIFD